ncbi:MAG TPA: ATP-dependent DNA helicase [Acidimicrobiales bacterium]|nr:ATP-dependent DNA helicase [Acidimicrobiales bacterium]
MTPPPSTLTPEPLLTLTPEQQTAVGAPLTPLLLVAGAGAGKTTVVGRRILHVVEKNLARADEVLGLTFTNKAAHHLKKVVREVLGPDAGVTIGTYHSFGASLVADNLLELGLDTASRVLDHAESWQLLFAVFDEFRFERRRTLSPQLLLRDALNLASRCADHLVPIDVVLADSIDLMANARWKGMKETAAMRAELCQVVAAYQRRKKERNLLDYGDQIALAVQLLTDNPAVAEECRRQHRVVLLDEYQDTNFAQRRMLQLLYPASGEVSGAPAITAVGDDMQSIYGFRGAHLLNIFKFTEHFPPAATLPLQTTFRFGPALVELANRIQGQVSEALPKKLEAAPGAPATKIECFLAADDASEAEAIAGDLAGRGVPWAANAILCRKRRLIGPIVVALLEHNVPVEVVGGSGLLSRPEVVDVVAWLEVLADPSLAVPLLRILQGPEYRLGLRDLAALARHMRTMRERAGDGDIALIDAAGEVDQVPDLSDDARARIESFCARRAALASAADSQTLVTLVETVVRETGLWAATTPVEGENLLRFLDLASHFDPVEGESGLRAFVEYLQLLTDAEEDLAEAHASGTDAVQVMTIHQAKGLEFPFVYVPGLAGSKGPSRIFPDSRSGENALGNSSALPWWLREDEGIPFPNDAASKSEIDEFIKMRRIEEEWRLLYVACTRAQNQLVCSAAHWYRGALEPQGPSPFYEFIRDQADIVTERFSQEPAEVAPHVVAMQSQRDAAVASASAGAASAGNYVAPVAPVPVLPTGQLRFDGSAAVGQGGPARAAPSALSVTALVTYARCPKEFYWSVVRPRPRRASGAARVGTQVHRWIEERSGRQLTLIEPEADVLLDGPDPDELPAEPGVVARLKQSFLASVWAALDPVRVEAPFTLVAGGHVVRGRIDAVYERDGRLELVDFKTGRLPSAGDQSASVQLDLYGLAAVDTWRADPDRIRTTYCYLRADRPPVVESVDWTAATLDKVRADLSASLDAVTGGRFGATPGAWCGRCDFQSFCPAGKSWLRATMEA